MKCSLGIFNFLEEIFSLSHSVVFLYFFALKLKKAFLSLLAILWNSAFRCLYLFFSPLLFTSFLFTAICKASPDSHFAFLHFFSMMMVFIPVSCTMSQTSFHRKAMPQNAQTITQLHSSHMLVKKCSKFSKPGFNSTWTMNFQMFKVLGKADEPGIKLAISAGSLKKQESSRKTSSSALLTMPKPLTVWITKNCGKFWERWEYQTTWPAS